MMLQTWIFGVAKIIEQEGLVVPTQIFNEMLFYWNLVLLIATILAARYAWRQMRQPYAFFSWRLGWIALFSAIVIMAIRRIVEIPFPLDVNLLWWWPWFVALDTAIMPTLLVASLLFAMVMLARIFQQPLTTLDVVYLPAQITIDQDSIVQAWNDEAIRMFGYTEVQALGQPITELIMPMRFRESHRRGIMQLLSHDIEPLIGMEKVYVVMAYRADVPTREFPIEVTVKIDRDATGRVLFHGRIRKLLAF